MRIAKLTTSCAVLAFSTQAVASPAIVTCEFKTFRNFSQDLCEYSRGGSRWFSECDAASSALRPSEGLLTADSPLILEMEIDLEARTAMLLNWSATGNHKFAFRSGLTPDKSYPLRTTSRGNLCSNDSQNVCLGGGPKYIIGSSDALAGQNPSFLDLGLFGSWQGRGSDIALYNRLASEGTKVLIAIGTTSDGIVDRAVIYRLRSLPWSSVRDRPIRFVSGATYTGRIKPISYSTGGAICDATIS